MYTIVVVYEANLNHQVVSDRPSACCCFQIRTAIGVYKIKLKNPTAYPSRVAIRTGVVVAADIAAVAVAVAVAVADGNGIGGSGVAADDDDDDNKANPSKNNELLLLLNPIVFTAEDIVVLVVEAKFFLVLLKF